MARVPQKKTNRVEKVNSLLEHLLGRILLPYLQTQHGIASISKVQTSRDLRWAKIWISIVGDEADDHKIMETLKNNIYEIQGEINHAMEVKIVPRISFFLDTSGRHAAHINDIFRQIEQEREENNADNHDTAQ